jgi:UDP-N-acetylmuramate--alanine ligase
VKQLFPEEVDELLSSASPGASVYLIGAGGCGMSALAHLLIDLGFKVSGSDIAPSEEVSRLQARGARIYAKHEAVQISESAPVLVVYSSAIRRDNLELEAAEQQKLPIVRRAILLSALLRRQQGVCVAGMHGKTTTTALLAYALEQLGQKPSFAVGASVPQLQPHARFSAGADRFFVVEADESDGTLRSFHPQHAIILNVDEEHLDYYANLEAVCREFKEFGAQTAKGIIFCADDSRLLQLFGGRKDAVSYGFDPAATYRLEKQASILGSRFTVWKNGASLGEFSLRLIGEKNISNAGAVVTFLDQQGFSAPEIAAAISEFRGAARRQQELFRDDKFRVIDDYGHHPSEIEATLSALRALRPGRLLVAFQPHRFSRTQHLLRSFATCFKEADLLWVTEVYAASEPQIAGVDGSRLAEAIRAQGQMVDFVPDLADLRRTVRAAMQPGDLVLFLGAGDITKYAHAMAAELSGTPMVTKEQLLADFAGRLSPAATLKMDEPLAKRTTLRVGGRTDFYVEPASEADLAAVLRFCSEQQLPFTMIGRGSNLLIKDSGIRGVVICLGHSAFSQLKVSEDKMECGAGVKLKTISVEARRNGLAGLEFLEGIPGSLGGSLRMNAGAMGSWLFEVVDTVRFMDYSGNVHERRASEVNVEYRGCPLFKNHIALGAVLKGIKADSATIAARMNGYSNKRWESQPAAPSAGCIFKNPKTIPAGKLIDELGLKGTRVGGAAVSDVHGNFIVNEGNATAQDVLNLIEIIKQRAKSARGIELETEVQIIGD